MAKPFLCRFGVAQISVNPAYADELVSSIQEPAFPAENQKVGLFPIAGLEEIGRIQQGVAEKYITHLNHKAESVTRFAANNGVELLLFPEYSIPPESLPLCNSLSQELGIAIIAGSHVVTLSQTAQQIYHDLEIRFADANKPADERVRQAASVVFVPGEKPIAFTKYVKSKWEGCLVEGTPAFHSFQMNAKRGRIEVQLLICIEALAGKQPKEKHNVPRLVAVTAFTPKAAPFYDQARLTLLKGKCTAFANVAEFGESKVFARAENTSLWFTERDGSKPIPRASEALLIVEADLEKQFEVRQTVTEQRAVTDLRLFPILYATQSAEAKQYADLIDLLSPAHGTPSEIGLQVSPFTALNANVFPKLLRDKLAHLLDT